MTPKSTSDIISGAIQFALNDVPTSKQIAKRDYDSHLFLNSINAICVDSPSPHDGQYLVKITFDYSPPLPVQEDLAIWIGFNHDGTYKFVHGEQQ